MESIKITGRKVCVCVCVCIYEGVWGGGMGGEGVHKYRLSIVVYYLGLWEGGRKGMLYKVMGMLCT